MVISLIHLIATFSVYANLRILIAMKYIIDVSYKNRACSLNSMRGCVKLTLTATVYIHHEKVKY